MLRSARVMAMSLAGCPSVKAIGPELIAR